MALVAIARLDAPAHADEPSTAAPKPNIVFILADDMGYGDIAAQNPRSKIPTPHLDRLAADGMRFTDAHSGSAVCTPTRYGLLTGRYAWRTRLKSGVFGGYSAPLIERERRTVATLLHDSGYATAMVGKWHLGMDMTRLPGDTPPESRWDGDGNVDYSKPIANGPTARGFDHYFGVSASLDMAPYVWIEDDHFSKEPTIQNPATGFPRFVRAGPRSDDLEFDHALATLAKRAARYIEKFTAAKAPFFLYAALTGPHKPVVPHPDVVGKSGLGPYGDFVIDVDRTVGEILTAIEKAGVRDNTVVIYSSDNGSFMYRHDDASTPDHVGDETVQAYRSAHHTPNGPLRGTKADIWEAGHRVPLIVRWPGRIAPASTCDVTVCLVDFFATAAEIVGVELRNDEAEDSFSLLPLFEGKQPLVPRAPVIHHSVQGMFAIRDGRWKLVAGNGSGGRERPAGTPFARPYALFDLDADLGETKDLIEKEPKVAAELEARLDAIRERGRSRP